jgi:hypothetical protein
MFLFSMHTTSGVRQYYSSLVVNTPNGGNFMGIIRVTLTRLFHGPKAVKRAMEQEVRAEVPFH